MAQVRLLLGCLTMCVSIWLCMFIWIQAQGAFTPSAFLTHLWVTQVIEAGGALVVLGLISIRKVVPYMPAWDS